MCGALSSPCRLKYLHHLGSRTYTKFLARCFTRLASPLVRFSPLSSLSLPVPFSAYSSLLDSSHSSSLLRLLFLSSFSFSVSLPFTYVILSSLSICFVLFPVFFHFSFSSPSLLIPPPSLFFNPRLLHLSLSSLPAPLSLLLFLSPYLIFLYFLPLFIALSLLSSLLLLHLSLIYALPLFRPLPLLPFPSFHPHFFSLPLFFPFFHPNLRGCICSIYLVIHDYVNNNNG